MKKHSHKLVALTLVSAVAAFATFAAPSAEADTLAGIACNIEPQDYPGDYLVNASGIANASWGPLGRARALHCPVPTSFRSFSGSVTTPSIFVDVFDGNNDLDGQVTARICMRPFGTTNPPICAAPVQITTGTVTGATFGSLDSANLTLLRSNSSMYADMIVTLPKQGVLGASQLFGAQF